MADESFLVPPVERNIMPLVVRRSEARADREKEKSQYETPASKQRNANAKKIKEKTVVENCISGNKVDCKI